MRKLIKRVLSEQYRKTKFYDMIVRHLVSKTNVLPYDQMWKMSRIDFSGIEMDYDPPNFDGKYIGSKSYSNDLIGKLTWYCYNTLGVNPLDFHNNVWPAYLMEIESIRLENRQ